MQNFECLFLCCAGAEQFLCSCFDEFSSIHMNLQLCMWMSYVYLYMYVICISGKYKINIGQISIWSIFFPKNKLYALESFKLLSFV